MLTVHEASALKPNSRVFDLVQNKYVYACTCQRTTRARLDYIRSNRAEFSMSAPERKSL